VDDQERLLNDLVNRINIVEYKIKYGHSNVDSEIKAIKEDIEELRRADSKGETSYVSRERYAPVERLVYGFVGLVLVAVLMAIIALVIGNPS